MRLVGTVLVSVVLAAYAFRPGDGSVAPVADPYAPALGPDTLDLPVLVGFGRDGGIDTSSTTIALRAGAAGADSLFIHAMNAAYEANDFPGKRTWAESAPAATELHGRRDDAACVRFRVNDGEFADWICDWNDAPEVNIRWRERTTRGASGFGGWYSNVRAAFAIPRLAAADVLVAEFRWNGTEGMRSGYRIFEIDLIGAGGAAASTATVLSHRDPESFAGYSAHSDSVAAGRRAWFARNTLSDFGPDGRYVRIVGSCQDCHVSEGLDLRRFNFEPEAVYSRSRFHALDEAKSRRIVDYVMSLDLGVPESYDYDADGVAGADERGRSTYHNCRPWHPPFQPGPGLDRLPVGEWICGAGAGAVLEADHLMARELFPTGFDADSIAALYGGRQGDDWQWGINRREMRIPHQLDVWNGWLPRVSMPDVGLDWAAYCASANTWCYETNDLGNNLSRGRFANSTPTTRARAVEMQRGWFQGTSGGVGHEFFVYQNGRDVLPMKEVYETPSFWKTIAQVSVNSTLGLRVFDVMTNRATYPWNNEYGVPETAWEVQNDIHCQVPNTPRHAFTWDDGSQLLGPTGPGTARGRYASTRLSSSLNRSFANRVTCAEARGMSAAQADWTIFAMSTHIAARDSQNPDWDYSAENGPAVSEPRNGFDGSIWYELAAILETPNRWTAPGSLSDWNYLTPHTFGAQRPGGPASMLAIANGLVMIQVMMGPMRFPGTSGNFKQWHPHHASQQIWQYKSEQWPTTAQQLGADNAIQIQAGLAMAWLDWAERFDYESYDGHRGAGYGEMDLASATFENPGRGAHLADWMTPGYFILNWTAVLHNMGAPAPVVDRMARYGAGLFDQPSSFAAYFCPSPGCGARGQGVVQ